MARTKITGSGLGLPTADGAALGGASNEWSDLYLADSGVIYFGNDQDVTVTHDPDDGLFLKSTATADNNPFLLTLQTGETDIASDDVIGKIAFQAPDEGTGTDAILVAAAIQARSEGDFSSSANATSLDFMTGASEAAASKMSITSGGDVNVLTDGASLFFGADSEIELRHVADDGLILKHVGTGDGKEPSLTFQAGDNDIAADDVLGSIFFQAPDEGAGTDAILVAAGIEAVSEGDFSSSNNATKLVFKTGASEAAAAKMSVTSGGDVNVLTDGASIFFGADSEIELRHVADDGLILKHVGTADGKEPSLTFQAGDNDIAANDVLGSIFFQAPDEGAGTDAITVAAGIEAVSEGDFSSSNNATKLSFKTGASEAATEKMSLSSAGILTIADDLIIGDGKTIGSASDVDAITIAADGAVTFSQTPVFPDGSIAIADLDIDGGTDINAAIVDADLLIVDDGAGGTNRKTTAARLKTYAGGSIRGIEFIIDGGGTTITTGVKGYLEIPFACTINRATILADQSGSIVGDIWKDTYANYPPVDGDSITASAPVTISSATKNQDSSLSGWTTSISAGDILGYNVDSISTCERVTVSLKVTT